ncbi:MAG: Ig-like domain-containing protein [Gammaproteobacteria bacterium]
MTLIKKGLVAWASVAVLMLASSAAFARAPVFAAAATTVPPAVTQWSGNPAVNLAVGYGAGDQVQSKVVPTSDGGVWISWFDAGTSNYSVRIQRLNALGQPQLGPNGILVAKRYFSSTQDYDLSVDANNDAVLAFRISNSDGSNVQIEAQMVKPDGTLAWGANGVKLGNAADYLAEPKITATSDGQYVVGWADNADIDLARLDNDGNPVWTSNVVISDPNGAEVVPGALHGSGNGSAILSYVSESGFSGPKHLFAQKINADATLAWTPAVAVFDGGSLQFGNFPGFIPDGSGGAVFAWYSASPALQTYVQHIKADGSEAFPHNGVLVSTNTTDIQVEPSAAYDPVSQDIFVFWTEEDAATQGNRGVYGQMIGPDGKPAWGHYGISILPLVTNADYLTSTVAIGDSAVVFYAGGVGYGQETIGAARLGADSKYIWNPSKIAVSSTPAEKSRMNSIVAANGMAVLAWGDSGTGDSDILAQNVNVDGRLGNHTPVASAGSITTAVNAATSGQLEATNPGGDTLVFSIVTQPQHGTVTINDAGTGAFTYTPNSDYSGSDSFTFMASDGAINSNVATVSVTVYSPPVASDGSLSTKPNKAASGTLVATDPEGNPLTFSIVTQPSHGTVTIDDASTGAYTYTPEKGFKGNDSFTFKANDGIADSNVATVKVLVFKLKIPGGGGAFGLWALIALLSLAMPMLLRSLRRRND